MTRVGVIGGYCQLWEALHRNMRYSDSVVFLKFFKSKGLKYPKIKRGKKK